MSIDVERICRTCLSSTEPLLSIYDRPIDSLGALSVADMLCEFTTIKPKHSDNMPAKVCFACLSEINRSYSFKLKCKQSNQTLRKFLTNVLPEETETVTYTNVKQIDKEVQTVLCFKTKKVDITSQQLEMDAKTSGQNKSQCNQFITIYGKTPNEDSETNENSRVGFQTQYNIPDSHDQTINVEEDDNADVSLSNAEKTEDCDQIEADKLSSNKSEQTRVIADNLTNPSTLQIVSKKTDPQTMRLRSHKKTEAEDKRNVNANDSNCIISDSDDRREKALFGGYSKPIRSRDSNTIKITYFCSKCNAGFVRHNSLIYHQKQNICTSRSQKCSGSKSILSSTEVLDENKKMQQFSHKSNAGLSSQRVLENHHSRNRCKICKNVFATSVELKDHMRKHSGDKPFMCALCERRFRFRTNMIQHVKRHNKERDYKCDHCPRIFVTRSKLFHHKLKHSDNALFCNTENATSDSYTKYRRKHRARLGHSSSHKNDNGTHDVKKLFRCSYCDKTFTCQTDWQTHETDHADESQYSCFCGRSFVLLSSLRFHFMSSHNSDDLNNKSEMVENSDGAQREQTELNVGQQSVQI